MGKRLLVVGQNGKGKTSFLEALYLLATGKSFRHGNAADLVQHGTSSLVIHAKQSNPSTSLGYQKTITNNSQQTKIHYNSEPVKSIREFVKHTPVLLYNQDTVQLVHSTAQFRRRYLDWGLFHVKPNYINCWSAYMKTLRLRNGLLRAVKLKRKIYDPIELDQWDSLLVEQGNQLNKLRQEMFSELGPLIEQRALEVSLEPLSAEYYNGYSTNPDHDFLQILKNNQRKDLAVGTTTQGPHRADIVLKLLKNKQKLVKELYSRGQIKCLSLIMLAASAEWYLKKYPEKSLLLLIDDFTAELDTTNQKRIISALHTLNVQMIITMIEGNDDVFDPTLYRTLNLSSMV